jgi:hypothetical protein
VFACTAVPPVALRRRTQPELTSIAPRGSTIRCPDVRIGIWVVVRFVYVRTRSGVACSTSPFRRRCSWSALRTFTSPLPIISFLAKIQRSQLNRAVEVPSTYPTTLNESALVRSPCSAEEAGEFALPEYISSTRVSLLSIIYTRRLIHEISSIHYQYTRDPGRIYTIPPIQNFPFGDSQLLHLFLFTSSARSISRKKKIAFLGEQFPVSIITATRPRQEQRTGKRNRNARIGRSTRLQSGSFHISFQSAAARTFRSQRPNEAHASHGYHSLAQPNSVSVQQGNRDCSFCRVGSSDKPKGRKRLGWCA